MATGADEDGVVRGISVAIVAQSGSAVRNREPGVVERRASPGRCGMAGLTSGWKAGRRMSWIGCCGVHRSVTGVAVAGRTCVPATHVAACAGNSCVLSR